MKKQLLIGLGIAAVLVVALRLLSVEGSVMSIGAVSANHADLECGECHDAFTSFSDDTKCVGCHEDSQMTPVARFETKRCVGCHVEHGGEDVELTEVGAQNCRACHDIETVHVRAPVTRAWKLEKEPRNCLTCHGNHDEHRLNDEPSLADARRHLVAAHRRGSPMYHKDTCEKCHMDKNHASGRTAASKPGFFDPHVTHVERLQIRCVWCHQDVDITTGSGKTLRRSSNVERCVQCHAGEYYAAKGTE